MARCLIHSLSADGWLLLGASDPLLSGLVECDVVATDAGLAYRKRDAHRARAVPPLRAADHPALHATDYPPAAPSRPLAEAARAALRGRTGGAIAGGRCGASHTLLRRA